MHQDDPNQVLYERLVKICTEFCTTPYYHQEHLMLLNYPTDQWIEMHTLLHSDTPLTQQIRDLAKQDVVLSMIHRSTPDQKWFLLTFYCSLIDAIVATALLPKSAYQKDMIH